MPEIDSLVKWTKEDSLYLMLTMAVWSSGYGNYEYVTSFWAYTHHATRMNHMYSLKYATNLL